MKNFLSNQNLPNHLLKMSVLLRQLVQITLGLRWLKEISIDSQWLFKFLLGKVAVHNEVPKIRIHFGRNHCFPKTFLKRKLGVKKKKISLPCVLSYKQIYEEWNIQHNLPSLFFKHQNFITINICITQLIIGLMLIKFLQ